ncbi:MAG: STAS domain-containing protein [Armatimonadota bacterium]
MQFPSPEILIVQFTQPADAESPAGLKQRLLAAVEHPGHVVLDLRPVRLDAGRLGVILSLQRRLELQGRRLVVAGSADLTLLLERAGAEQALTVFPDPAQAEAFARSQPAVSLAA